MSDPDSETQALIGESPTFVEMLEHVSIAAKINKPVLVIGERGTGKELIAARLHYLSDRWEQSLVRVNCAALTETLLESELFGHESGAFTGASRTHIGCFEQAEGGTLVLDELGTIPLRMQENILRVIEYGEFRRVGGTKTLRSDARIVGSTNEDLPALAAKKAFRADLLDRLAFDVIHVPPLRARPEDILSLALHFAVNMTAELKRSYFAGFADNVGAELLSHQWPGNVRELKNTIERSLYRMNDAEQPLEELYFDPFDSPFLEASETSLAADAANAPESTPTAISLPTDFSAAVTKFETELLNAALKRSNFKQTTAAEMLSLSYHQLRGLLKKYALLKRDDTQP